MVEKRDVRATRGAAVEEIGKEEEEAAKVGSLEKGRRAKVRGDVWVNRLTAGTDMVDMQLNWN